MTRLGQGWQHYTLGLLCPPAQAWPHFQSARGALGPLKEGRVPTLEDFARITHLVTAILFASVLPTVTMHFKKEKLLSGAVIWITLFHLDYFFNNLVTCAINTCRLAYATVFSTIHLPGGFTKGSAISNGNCFYDSILQQYQPEGIKNNEEGRMKLRSHIADALVKIGEESGGQSNSREVFNSEVARILRIKDPTQVTANDYKAVANQIRMDLSRWADDLEISLLIGHVEAYKDVRLCIYAVRNSNWSWTQFFNNREIDFSDSLSKPILKPELGQVNRRKMLNLINWNQRHYEPLLTT